jgi:hypothetical protein
MFFGVLPTVETVGYFLPSLTGLARVQASTKKLEHCHDGG